MNDNFTEDSFMTEENMARMRKKIAEGNQLCWTSTVETFLNAFIFDEHQSDVQLVVPEYQRDYAWECIEKRERSGGISKKKGKNNQLALFFQDLAKVNSGTAYHLGTIILHHESVGPEKCVLNIVDGQQRLRTFEAIARVAQEPAADDFDKAITNINQACKLKRKKSNQEELVTTETTEPLFKEAIEYCLGKISANQGVNYYKHLQRGTIVCIVVKTLDEAFQLFETQNGRGKSLWPEDLLKAFHYHEMTSGYFEGCPMLPPSRDRRYELEHQWNESVARNLNNGSVLTKYLFWAREWTSGEKKRTEFQRLRHLCEYKGLTLHKSQIPKKNIWLLCHLLRRSVVEAGLLKPYLAQKVSQQRTLKDGELNECLGVEQDPFVSITQQIINGEDFFEYARTYASLEQRLFEKTEPTGTIIKTFQTFYNRFSPLSRTDAYARDVYKTFVLLTVDNFGEEGLNRLYKPLWILAYYERILNGSLRFATAGETYGKKVCRLLAMKGSIEEVAMEIAILVDEAKKQLDMETNSANYRGIERFLERYEKFKNIEFCERCAGCEWGEK